MLVCKKRLIYCPINWPSLERLTGSVIEFEKTKQNTDLLLNKTVIVFY